MVDCGRRAFDNDALEHAILPDRSAAVLDSNEMLEFRMNRIRKRLQSPDWRYVLATVDPAEGPAKIVGYAGWMAPPTQENITEQERKQKENVVQRQVQQQPPVKDEDTPKGLDMDTFKYINELIEKTKKEILGEDEQRVWYLASLAVDPEFKGKGIASKLVQWGVDKAEEAGLPAYLESSPAAVGVYRRVGFKELRKLRVIKSDESHFLTIMLRTPGSTET